MSKILIVGQWFVSEDNKKIKIPGGTERYVYGLAKQLHSDGYKVMVLSGTTNKDETGVSILDGLDVYKFKISEKIYGFYVDFLSVINTLKFIIRFNPDIVHVISARYRFATGAVAAAKITRTKTVYTRTTLPRNENKNLISVLLDEFIFTKIIKQADVIIALSREMETVLEQETNPKLIKVIPSFTMKSYYCSVEKDDKRLLFVGRLDRLKGIDYLIDSLVLVKKEIPEVRLSIVGIGDQLMHLKEKVSMYGLEENVTFEGLLGDDALVKMYSRSEVFVFPSLTEGMPMVLLEAMSAGLTIIAFDIGPNVEVLDGGRYGILVKKEDVKSLAKKITELLKNKEQRVYYSRISLEKSKEYMQEIVVRRIEEVYSSLE